MDPSKHKVLIVGAGLGGLAAALALLQRGFDVTVVEQARRLAEIGAGVQIGPNASKALIALGLKERIEQVACESAGKEIRHYQTGESWKVLDLGEFSLERFQAPYWLVHRADLHSLLVDSIRESWPNAIQLNSRCIAVRQNPAGVEITLDDKQTLFADILVGADGIHSVVRNHLFGDLPATFLGRAAWRGLIEAKKLPEHLRRGVGVNWVGPDANVVTYPVRRGELVNFVGAVRHDNWFEESWNTRGSIDECLACFKEWHPDVQNLIRGIEVPYKWAYRGRDPLPRWTFGRITLLGDAAHPTLPTLAQGACMAIEDGIVLSRCIEAYGVFDALAQYERARLERTSRIVRESAVNGKRFHDRILGDDRSARGFIQAEWASNKVEARYGWLFEYDPTSASI